jgi:hypothetical protein
MFANHSGMKWMRGGTKQLYKAAMRSSLRHTAGSSSAADAQAGTCHSPKITLNTISLRCLYEPH